MKVVINTCQGGFRLSNEAFENLLTKKGIEFEAETGGAFTHYYRKGEVGNDAAYLNHYDFYGEENRADTDLIGIIEEMGETSFGDFAQLKIVEVPDDVEWQIEEYDGAEWIAEKHRTWY